MEHTLFVARDKDGKLFLFNGEPTRGPRYNYKTDSYEDEFSTWLIGGPNVKGIEDYDFDMDIIQLPRSLFPDQKWEDEPKEVTLVSIIDEKELGGQPNLK